MNSLERLVGILDQFEGEKALMTAEELHARLGYTRSTLYRYLKLLTNAGLLSSLHSVGYTLGPRITELDYRIRVRDPMIAASKAPMLAIARDHHGIGLLCRRYRDTVLCVHQESGTDTFRSNYERGLARPLFRGAASRVILAWLPAPHLRKLYEAHAEEFARMGIGGSLAETRSFLRRIRMQGYDCTSGQVTPGVTGVASPVLDASGAVVGSLCLVVGKPSLPEAQIRLIGDRLTGISRSVGAAISPSA